MSGRTLIGGLGYDRQQQMRWPLRVPIDPVGNGPAAAHCQARAISHGDTDVSLLDHQLVSARSAAVFRRRLATAGAVATDRIRAARLDYATLLYVRKVYDGMVEWADVSTAGSMLATGSIMHDRSNV
jgi:hypothetical protein